MKYAAIYKMTELYCSTIKRYATSSSEKYELSEEFKQKRLETFKEELDQVAQAHKTTPQVIIAALKLLAFPHGKHDLHNLMKWTGWQDLLLELDKHT